MSLCILLEWVPPEPEPFYQPTENEMAPEVMGEDRGTVVYVIDPGICIYTLTINCNKRYSTLHIVSVPVKKNAGMKNVNSEV